MSSSHMHKGEWWEAVQAGPKQLVQAPCVLCVCAGAESQPLPVTQLGCEAPALLQPWPLWCNARSE